MARSIRRVAGWPDTRRRALQRAAPRKLVFQVRAVARVRRASLRRAAPRVMGGLEGLLRRAGRGAPLVSLAVTLGFVLFLGAWRTAWIARERAQYLVYPAGWSATSRARLPAEPSTPRPIEEAAGLGGASDAVYPLRIMTYTARSGDTLSTIARRFGLQLDTVSSLNRVWGNGVHLVVLGEKLRIPNQDGIFIAVNGDLETLAGEKNLLPETILAVNEVDESALKHEVTLFFPGVQHGGQERRIIEGSAFFYPLVGRISSGYGRRRDPFNPNGPQRFHYGVDFSSAAGTPVRAARGGTVWIANDTGDAVFGKQVLIGHDFGMSTFYAHMQGVIVRRGQTVSAATVIGYVGATGRVTGPHLHFEIRVGGFPRDPVGLLARRRP